MLTAKYRKRSPVVDAVQVDSSNYDGMCEIARWCGGLATDDGTHVIYIDTPEERVFIDPNDWLVNVAGEIQVFKPALFDATYERLM